MVQDFFSESAQARLGRAIRAARDARGWTLRELGSRAAVSHVTVLRLESGENTNLDSAARVAAALGIPLTDLIGDASRGIGELLPWWEALSAEEQHHVRALVSSIAASRGQRPALRAAEDRAPYLGANAAAIEDARRESERLSESEDRDQEDGGEQRQRRRRAP